MAKIRFQQGDISAQENPPAGQFIVMYDLDGKLKQKDSSGVIAEIGSGTSGGSLKRSYKQVLPDNLTTGDTNLYVINDTIFEVDNPNSDYSLKYLDNSDVAQVIPFVYGRSYHAKINAIKSLPNGAVKSVSSISSLYSIDDYANTVGNFNIGSGVVINPDYYDRSVGVLNDFNGLKAWVSYFDLDAGGNLYFTSVYKGGAPQPVHLIDATGAELSINPSVLSLLDGAVTMLKVGNNGHVYLGVTSSGYPWSSLYKVYEDGSDLVAGFSADINSPIQVSNIKDLASDASRIFVLSNGGGEPSNPKAISVLSDSTGDLLTSYTLPSANLYDDWDSIVPLGGDRYLILKRPAYYAANIIVLEYTSSPDTLTDVTASFVSNLNSNGILLVDILDIVAYGSACLITVKTLNKAIRTDNLGNVLPADDVVSGIVARLDIDEFIIRAGTSYFITNKYPHIKTYNITEGLVNNFAVLGSTDLASNSITAQGSSLLITGCKNIVGGLMLIRNNINETLTDNAPKYVENSVLLKSEPQDKLYTKIPKLAVNADDELTLDLGEQVDTAVVSIEILETVGQYNPLGLLTS